MYFSRGGQYSAGSFFMSGLRQRVSGMVGVMLLASACGALAGYWWGWEHILHHVEGRLDQFAVRVRAEGDISAAEGRAVLDAINASHDAYCSEAEIAHLRRLVYASQFLKDGARVRNGRVDCTAEWGRVAQPDGEIGSGVARGDGTRLFRDTSLFRIPGQTVIAVEKGDALIVYSPFNLRALQGGAMHYTVSDLGPGNSPTSRLLGEQPLTQSAILTREGEAHIGNMLYATRCSTRFASCMTAYMSTAEAFQADRNDFEAYLGLSALSGALLGFACSMAYRRTRSLEQQLRRAIRRDAIRVAYQPIVELDTGRIVGAEALARWTNEEKGEVSPDVFIRIAEERGFVGEITRLVVHRALAELSGILPGCPEFRVSVNIAPQDLCDPEFVPMLEQATATAGVPAQCLVMEITERAAADPEVAKEAILRLRGKGHSVHIDDFGTGYSSLAYLHDLSVDGLKIDKAFTQAVGTESVQVLILPQIFSLAAALRLQVTVEGIETEEQARYFRSSPLPMQAQGWFLGRPMPAEEFLRVFEEQMRTAEAAI